MKKAGFRKNVNTVEAKNRLNELIAEVNRSKEPVVVEKRGTPVAVVVDYESYRKEQKSDNQAEGKAKTETFLKELRAFHEMMRREYPKGTGDSVEILRQIREERSSRW